MACMPLLCTVTFELLSYCYFTSLTLWKEMSVGQPTTVHTKITRRNTGITRTFFIHVCGHQVLFTIEDKVFLIYIYF